MLMRLPYNITNYIRGRRNMGMRSETVQNHLFKSFAGGDEQEKVMVAQWLDEGVNSARIGWSVDSFRKDNRIPEIVANSMVVAGLLTTLSLTPAALVIGGGLALLGQGVKFMEEACAVSNAHKELKWDLNRDVKKMKQEAAPKQKGPAPKMTPSSS